MGASGLLRNKDVRIAAGLGCAAVAAGVVGAWEFGGSAAAGCALLGGGAAMGAWLWATARRHAALAELACKVGGALDGRRDVRFDTMNEGELAILASELDKMCSRLALNAEELEREKRTLAEAMADISHQLKTPMTSLSLMTVLVRRRLSETEGMEGEVARLRSMESLEERVQWLVAGLLKLARLDAGVVSFARERVDADRLAARAFEPLALSFDLADVRLVTDIQTGAGFTGDLAWTAEALGNVLKNCMEHTPAGGVVTLSAWEDALAFRIRVDDTGPGIAEADLPHIFERFYRGPGEASPAGGVGIGLALAQGLVSAQGGSLRAGNVPGGGARFDFAFFKTVV